VDDRKGDGDKEIRDALQLLFYDKIKYLGRKYVAAKSISFEELEDLDIFHKFYKKSLNGNGTLDGLMGLVHGLQVRT
jgi:hypothetical protein